MTKVLITGGAGYIGSHVALRMRDAGYEVLVLDNLSTGNRPAVPTGVELVRTDLVNVGDVLNRSFDAVIHLAAQALVGESVHAPIWYWQRNVSDSLTLIEAMLKHGVDRIVFASSAAVYGWPKRMPGVRLPLTEEDDDTKPCNPYGATKAAFETILRAVEKPHGIKSVSLRFFNAAGASESGLLGEDRVNETHLIPSILGPLSRFLYYGSGVGHAPDGVSVFGTNYETVDGSCIRDYVHVEDLADAHEASVRYLLEGGASTVCNLGTGTGFSVLQIISTCAEITGQEIKTTLKDRRDGDPDYLVAANNRAKSLLGWSPKRSDLRTIIRTAWEWHKSHPFGYKVKV